jgi:hypothetical protein
MLKHLFLPPILLTLTVSASNLGAVTAVFDFTGAFELHQVTASSMPVSITRDGIEMSVRDITGPVLSVPASDYLNPAIQRAFRLNINATNGLGIDNDKIANANFTNEYSAGVDDLGSESTTLNFLESVTLSFDRSVIISELAFRDFEQHEKYTVTVAGGPTVDILGSVGWSSSGSAGSSTWSGAALGALNNLLIQRDTAITITFDTVNPQDRRTDGTGNNLNASPSSALVRISVATPPDFQLGTPYVVQGGPAQASVACELWGTEAEVTLRWSLDPDSGWTNSSDLGLRQPPLITGATLTGLTPNTVWYYQFVANNGIETTESPVMSFVWYTGIFVSPGGDDGATGLSPASALRTIPEALSRIRAMGRRPQPEGPVVPNFYGSPVSTHSAEIEAHLANLVDPVTVHLLPGMHYLAETVVIDKVTDGNIHFAGLWADGAEDLLRDRLARHGEDPDWMNPPSSHMPVVSGGTRIAAWTETTVNGVPAWEADLPEVAAGQWRFDQLFVDGRRATRSRWPKVGWFRPEAVDNSTKLDFQVASRDLAEIQPAAWTNLQNAQTVLLHRWVETRNRIDSFDPVSRWIKLQPPASDYDLNASSPVHGAGLAPYYFDNVFETMSEPGEFYLNELTGKLYYIPLPGQSIDATEVIAPRLFELFRVLGKEAGLAEINERIWHVTFWRIAFLHTRAEALALHKGTGNNPNNSGRGALHFRFARVPVVEACLFGHVGEWGLEMAWETVGAVVSANTFRSLGFGAIKFWQNGNQVANLQQRNGWSHAHDNDVRGHGRYWHGGVAMLFTEEVFTEVEHNHVRDGFYNGIRAAGGAALLRNGFANRIAKNRVHDVGQGVLSDLAGLYVPSKNPYSVVEGNVVFNVNARDYTSPAVYLDGDAEYWTVRDNWLYGSNERVINMKGWSHNVYNNVIAFSGDHLVHRRNSDEPPHQSPEFPLLQRLPPAFARNIYLQNGSGYTYENSEYTQAIEPWAVSDQNLFWDQTADIWVRGIRRTLAQHQASEPMDAGSIKADPLFIDPQRGDFRLDPASPAVTQLGFTPVDNRDAGLRKAVWDAAGAVWYRPEPGPGPDWLPSDIPGLHAWHDAADFTAAGPLHIWNTKTSYTHMMRQFEKTLQPGVVLNAVNGLPVVRFSGAQWMGTQEHSWRTRRTSGQFQDREFVIFAAYRSAGDNNVLLAKGDDGASGKWTIGQQANAFKWNGTRHLGAPGTDFAVRAWRRGPSAWQYFENGELVATSAADLDHLFSSEDILYLGASGASGHLTGDVGEILIYRGHVSDTDIAAVQYYLMDKWLPAAEIPIFTADTIVESTAASGSAYLRSLTVHIGGGYNPAELAFIKVSGPDWLTVMPDGTLGGTPGAADTGVNTFTVRVLAATGQHTVTLQIEVVGQDSLPPAVPQGLRISIQGGFVTLEWNPSPEPDFAYYRVLRAATLDQQDFEAVASPVWLPVYSEVLGGDGPFFYKVRAIDTSGN